MAIIELTLATLFRIPSRKVFMLENIKIQYSNSIQLWQILKGVISCYSYLQITNIDGGSLLGRSYGSHCQIE